ncbi:E3 ubiquitin-protein ligase BRE1 [Encephalitozoon intestinalis ATCC 50506]|uniref:E3 ubiquitin protein ligase n=1 Tax=Encephalitozoon intestinalis (strain ATCC 50506) TaxID=876142 RepID=E0S922_ENCIT|nr:E3 ubiquitin-protein ligase BRE1 [Encephalitozoon intestinalis ATCC 50506]ADM12139.1 hypothetical protein Eint_090090 [Encephalitozoon intestinalis ATCC 50506]UTX45940.1 RING finger domain-containing protein [Encephalitozoon intestinalis]
MKKIKVDCGSFANSKVVEQLWEMISREDISLHQKSSIFLEMTEYKKMNEKLVKRNNELIEENASMVSILEAQKENPNNASSLGEEAKFDAGLKISELNYEIRRLDSVICEMQKRIARDLLQKETKDTPELERTEEKKHVVADSTTVTNEVYKKITEDYGDLKAKMAGLESKHNEELCERDQKIAKLQRELKEVMSNAKDMGERFTILNTESGKWKEGLQTFIGKELVLNNEISGCVPRLEKIEKDMEEIAAGLDVWMKKIEQLDAEKKELWKITENYKSYERVRNGSGTCDQGSLEDEIINLVESLDKSLGENKALVLRLEAAHKKNRELESEMISLKMASSDLRSRNAKLESDIKHLGMENRYTTQGDLGDHGLKIRKLESSLAEYNKVATDYKKRLYTLSKEKEETEKILESIKKQNREMRDEMSRIAKTNSQIEAENKRLSGVLRAIQNGGSEEDTDLAVQLERYRGLLRCTLCDTRFKDTAITKCMHCFCEECINSRIRMRDRKCPSCNEPFAPNDVKKIYL